jgi:dihydrofolate synthase/folylpolyglutamate synthase
MTYKQALNYVHSLLKFGSQLGLERIFKLLECLQSPQNDLKFIHIAGTNGKGSTTAMCSSILKHSGLKVGMYISPYVVDFKERFQINGKMISEQELIALVQIIKPKIDQLNKQGIIITEFEFITALAFLYFKNNNCDIVCLEVGLGGIFDATNVILPPLACVITSISLDHTQILGDTVEEITASKAGIIKQNCSVICYPLQQDGALQVISQKISDTNSSLVIPDINQLEIKSHDLNGGNFIYKNQSYQINLIGKFQIYNAIVAIETINVLKKKGYDITQKDIKNGLKEVAFPARFEILSKNPLVVIDGTHNLDGAKSLENTILNIKTKKITLILGMLADKDYENTIKLICPYAVKIITVPIDNPRALDYLKLGKIARIYCKNVQSTQDYLDAINSAFKNIQSDDMILVFGSLYLASEIRPKLIEYLKNKK